MSEYPIECPDCKKIQTIKDLKLKMGGLLCSGCHMILVFPNDPVYIGEVRRRKEAVIG